MSCENCEESAYVIDKLAKLLAEIAVIVNGVEPHDTSWSYHDLPEKVRALKQAQQPAAAVPEGYALVPVASLESWRDAFAEELGAWDIDPPLHHVKTSHDEIEAMLAAAERRECKV